MPLLGDPTNRWWDNVTTADVVEQRDDTLRTAFAAAYATAKQTLGPNKGTRAF